MDLGKGIRSDEHRDHEATPSARRGDGVARYRAGTHARAKLVKYSYASSLWSELPDDGLCIVDRGFFSAKVLLSLHDAQVESRRHSRSNARPGGGVCRCLGHAPAPGPLLVPPLRASRSRTKSPRA